MLLMSTHFFSSSGKSYEFNVEEKEIQYLKWLQNFVAKDPRHQMYCKDILSGKRSSASQFAQDLFLFFNVFKYWPMKNRRGFYIDSGANDAIELSNTYFFDVCLGWDGLCIEPENQYHEKLRATRSCILIPECLSSKKESLMMLHDGVMSAVQGPSPSGGTQCDSLQAIMSRYNRTGIDLWSLDVEGHELNILENMNFSAVNVRVALVEVVNSCTRFIDILFNDNGYFKYQQLAIDALYIKRGFNAAENIWYPKRHHTDCQTVRKFHAKDKNKCQ